MANVKDVTQTVVRGAKATAGRVGKKATEIANSKPVKRAVKQAKDAGATALSGVSALAAKGSEKLAGRSKNSKKRSRVKMALAVAGAVAVAAAGMSAAAKSRNASAAKSRKR